MKMWFVCFLGLLIYEASAQIGTGTVIVFHIAKDKFIVAADSRVIFKGNPEDDGCKIAAFNHQFVFAASGGDGYRPAAQGFDPVAAFDSVGEARKAVQSQSGKAAGDILKSIADAWADSMTRNLRFLYSIHPEIVLEAAKKGNGALGNGLFAKATKGEILLELRSITFSQERPDPIMPKSIPQDCAAKICAGGILDVFNEYTSFPPKSERAKREGIMKPTTHETARIKRLVQLSILYTRPIGEIGGPIDVLELWRDGSIHWIARKNNCPENQD